MTSQTIDGTSVTVEAVQDQLQKHFETKSKIVNFEETPIGLQQGFLSKIIRLSSIEWSPEEVKLPKSIIVKIPSIDNYAALTTQLDNDAGEAMQNIVEEHDIIRKSLLSEGAFYDLIKRCGQPTDKLCKSYGGVMPNRNRSDDKPGDQPAFLLLEDLSDYVTGDMMAGMTEGQLNSFVDALADMQAWSVRNMEEWVNDPDLQMTPDIGGMFEEDKLAKTIESFRTALHEDEQLSELFGDLKERVDELKCDDRLLKSFNSAVKEIHFPNIELPKVMVHSDAHPFNMMFVKNADGEASDELRAILDWQGVHPGYPTFDLLRLVCTSANSTMRVKYFPRVFDRWYARLVFNLGDEHAMKCTKQDLWKLTEIMLFYQQAIAIPFSPQVAQMKDGAIKGLVASRDNPRYMRKTRQAMIDALEIKKRLGLK